MYPRWTSDEAGGTLGEAGSHLEGITAASAPAVSLDDSASSSNAIFQPEVGVIDTTWASFLPSLGAAQEDQALPMLWDEVDFSWLTDGAEDSGNNSTPSPSASDRAQAEITEDQKQHLSVVHGLLRRSLTPQALDLLHQSEDLWGGNEYTAILRTPGQQ